MEDYASLIGTLGFPIFVCLWFMIRTEKVINNNTEVMREVIKKI